MLPLVRTALLCLTTLVTSLPAQALVCGRSCQTVECGFSFASGLDCSTRSANHALEMTVTCAEAIPLQAFPLLVDEHGEEWTASWKAIRDATTWSDQSRVTVYRLVTSELPPAQRFELRGVVPERCESILLASCTNSHFECGSEELDCCSVFERSGLNFRAARSLSTLGDDQGDESSSKEGGAGGNGGAGGASNDEPSAPVYVTFFTGAPDTTPPPALEVEPLCIPPASSQNADFWLAPRWYRITGPLEDVVRVEILGRPLTGPDADLPAQLVDFFSAAPCVDGEERTFDPAPRPDGLGLACPGPTPGNGGPWTFFARAIDGAGNTTDGPEVTLDYPRDCREALEHVPSPTHTCPPAQLPAGPNCAPQDPRAPFENQRHWCDVTGSPVIPEYPPPENFGLCSIEEPDEVDAEDGGRDDADPREADGDADGGCACLSAGAPSPLRFELFAFGALGLWGARRRRRAQTHR